MIKPIVRKTGQFFLKKGVKEGIKAGAKEVAKIVGQEALASGTKAAMDVLEGNKSVAQAVKDRGAESVVRTGHAIELKYFDDPILAKGGPRKRKLKVKVGVWKKARMVDTFD